jgi:hypothetical protein
MIFIYWEKTRETIKKNKEALTGAIKEAALDVKAEKN